MRSDSTDSLPPWAEMPSVPHRGPAPLLGFLAILVSLTLLIAAVGGYAYGRLQDERRFETERTLTLIAEQKRQQVENWLAQARKDARLYFTGQALFARLLAAWETGGRQDEALLAQSRARFTEIMAVRGWSALAVFDTRGAPILVLGPTDTAAHAQAVEEVLAHPRLVPVDLHLDPEGRVEYGLLTPVTQPDGQLLGVAYLSWRVEESLYPLISAWPVPTETAETFMVRREGDEIRYLTPLRHEPAAALWMRLPLDTPHLPAALAARGQTGILPQAQDYRGEPVLAYATAIADTPWLMIAKIHQREAQARMRETAWVSALVLGLILLLTYGAGIAWWRRERARALAAAREASARREGERLWKLALDAARDGVWDWHVQSDRVEFSHHWKAMLGYGETDLGNDLDTWKRLVHPEDLPQAMAAVAAHLAGETPRYESIQRLRCQDGSWKWVLDRGAVLERDADGQPRRMVGTHTDLTTHKAVEEELRKTRDALAKAQQLTHLGSFEYDLATRQSVWSEEEYRLYGLMPSGPPPSDDFMLGLVHPDDRHELLQTWTAALHGPAVFRHEHRILHPDGSVRWLYHQAFPDYDANGELARYLGTTQDITERKAAEERLLVSREHLRLATEGAQLGVWYWDLTTQTLNWSALCQEHLALPPGAEPSMAHFYSVVHPNDRARVEGLINASVAAGSEYRVEYRIVHPDGRARWLSAAGRTYRDAAGASVGMGGITHDITARKQAELDLLESERRYRELNADLERQVARRTAELEASKAAAEAAARAKSEFLAHMSHEIRTPMNAVLGLTQLLGRQALSPEQHDMVARIQGAGQSLLGIINDILDFSKIEAGQLQLAPRPFRLETLTAQVSSLLGPSAAAKGLELRIAPLAAGAPLTATKPLTKAETETETGTGTGTKTGAEAGFGGITDTEAVPGARAKAETDAGVGAITKTKAGSEAEAIGPLLGDALRLEQILINLTGNAIKFTAQGEVVLRITILARTAAEVRLRFEVRDTGIGISPEAQSNLFTPFTQADAGISRRFGGTGLGLSIAKRLVELMGGTIGVESTPGQGSTFWFEVSLPRAAARDGAPAAEGNPAPPAPPSGPRLRGLHILEVDDSALNRDLVERALQLEGARVTLAADGQQALQYLQGAAPPFDAVLMDVRMPVMDGLTATRAIRQDLGLIDLPILALTAGVLPEEQQAARDAGADEVLAKPLDLDLLATRLVHYIGAARLAAAALAGTGGGEPVALSTDFPDIPGIDRKRVAALFKDDVEFFLMILGRLTQEAATGLVQARQALAAGDRETLALRLHSLKGNAGNVGALTLMAAAGELEAAVKAGAPDPAGAGAPREAGETDGAGGATRREVGDTNREAGPTTPRETDMTAMSDLEAGLADLERQVADLTAAAAPWLAAASAQARDQRVEPKATDTLPPSVDTPQIAGQLAALHAALRRRDLGALDLFEDLERDPPAAWDAETRRTLGEAITHLRFETALELLEQVKVRQEHASPTRLGSRIAARFSGQGLDMDLPEL